MAISGLIVYAKPELLEYVTEQLNAMQGVDVHQIIEDHKIVIVIESDAVDREVEISRKIAQIDGVLGLNLVYHYFGE